MNDTTPLPPAPEPNSPESHERVSEGGSAHRLVRSGPIFWGVLFLIVCAWGVQQQFLPDLLSPGAWIAGAALALGLLLLVVGIVAAIRGSRSGG